MAIYKDTLDDAVQVVTDSWNRDKSKPFLFAKVRLKFGEKYMLDYVETQIRPGIEVIEDLSGRIGDICK